MTFLILLLLIFFLIKIFTAKFLFQVYKNRIKSYKFFENKYKDIKLKELKSE